MNRRRFITILASAAIGQPLPGRAQESAKTPKVGVLAWYGAASMYRLDPFRQALRDLGYIEGRNILLEYRFAEGRTDRAAELAAGLVRDQVNVIVASATPAAHAAKNATASIPIVFASADAVGTGLVTELARPRGNMTGVSLLMPDLAGKRLELLQALLPGIVRVAFLGATRDPAARQFVEESEIAAAKLAIRIHPTLVAGPEEFEAAFAAMVRESVGAVVVQSLLSNDPPLRTRIIEFAAKHRLPTISDFAEFARSGGLALSIRRDDGGEDRACVVGRVGGGACRDGWERVWGWGSGARAA